MVNIASISAYRGVGSSIAYGVSKAAAAPADARAGGRARPEVRVNSVSPGTVATRWQLDQFGEEGFAERAEAERAGRRWRVTGPRTSPMPSWACCGPEWSPAWTSSSTPASTSGTDGGDIGGGTAGAIRNATEKVLRMLGGAPRQAAARRPRPGRPDLPKSTVHRILQTMVERGVRDLRRGAGRYAPGPRLLGLAGRSLSRDDTTAGAEPALRRLQERTGATVHLAVLAGDEAVYVRKIEGNKPYRMVSRVGMAVPVALHGRSARRSWPGCPTDDVRAFAARAGLAAAYARARSPTRTRLVTAVEVSRASWLGGRPGGERGRHRLRRRGRTRPHRPGHGGGQRLPAAERPRCDPSTSSGPLVAAAAAEISAAYGAPAR